MGGDLCGCVGRNEAIFEAAFYRALHVSYTFFRVCVLIAELEVSGRSQANKGLRFHVYSCLQRVAATPKYVILAQRQRQ